MEPILKGSGLNESERFLIDIAEKTFLNLWAYANVFNAKGKELCDLFVVCGNDVIIFSDKSIAYSLEEEENVSWSRWFKKAITKSVKQVNGAERYLKSKDNSLFLDAHMEQNFPIALPSPGETRIHLVCVAVGVETVFKKKFRKKYGDFLIGGLDEASEPFIIGDVNKNGKFVHVFGQKDLLFILKQLDTISDFVSYLSDRARFMRENKNINPFLERDLYALYFKNGFSFPRGIDVGKNISYGSYDRSKISLFYKKFQKLKNTSYLWDRLIKTFTDNVLSGTTIDFMESDLDSKKIERALKYMALENRNQRCQLSEALFNMDEKIKNEKKGNGIFARCISVGGINYVFVVSNNINSETPENHRRKRLVFLKNYCLGFLLAQKNIKKIVGVAFDCSKNKVKSEDIFYAEFDKREEFFTDEMTNKILEDIKKLNIFNNKTMMFNLMIENNPEWNVYNKS